MGKLIAFLALVAGLALVMAYAAAPQLLAHEVGGATALTLAGGLFTIALAAYLKD
jgi:hypothetical protein